jgi:hypothetical protein
MGVRCEIRRPLRKLETVGVHGKVRILEYFELLVPTQRCQEESDERIPFSLR